VDSNHKAKPEAEKERPTAYKTEKAKTTGEKEQRRKAKLNAAIY